MFNYVQAFVRYATENEANTAWEKAQGEAEDGKVKMGDKELTATVLEGMIYSLYSVQDETVHRVLAWWPGSELFDSGI